MHNILDVPRMLIIIIDFNLFFDIPTNGKTFKSNTQLTCCIMQVCRLVFTNKTTHTILWCVARETKNRHERSFSFFGNILLVTLKTNTDHISAQMLVETWFAVIIAPIRTLVILALTMEIIKIWEDLLGGHKLNLVEAKGKILLNDGRRESFCVYNINMFNDT